MPDEDSRERKLPSEIKWSGLGVIQAFLPVPGAGGKQTGMSV